MAQARKTSATPKRGYTFHPEAEYYVRNGFTLVPCTGEAHKNAFIDNCGVCMSGCWGWALVKKEGQE